MAAIREFYLTGIFVLISRISGQQSGNATIQQCASSNLNIVFNFNLGGEKFWHRSWYLNSTANKIAEANTTGFLTVEPPYSNRVTLSGSNGITLSYVKNSDSGSYLFIIITDTTFTFLTATTTVIINETPNTSCIPVIENSINSFTCKIPAECPGKDSIQARWNDRSIAVLTCPLEITKYICCAVGDSVTYCYGGSLCTEIVCKGTQTFPTPTSSDIRTVSTPSLSSIHTGSSMTSSYIQTFPVIPVVTGVVVFIFLFIIMIICRCCYLQKRNKYKEYGTKWKETNYDQDNIDTTKPEDGYHNKIITPLERVFQQL